MPEDRSEEMKKTNPYKIGDRVYWYGVHGGRSVATVNKILDEAVYIDISPYSANFRFFLGRLKPKKPLRGVWVNFFHNRRLGDMWSSKEAADANANGRTECVHFVEKREKR